MLAVYVSALAGCTSLDVLALAGCTSLDGPYK